MQLLHSVPFSMLIQHCTCSDRRIGSRSTHIAPCVCWRHGTYVEVRPNLLLQHLITARSLQDHGSSARVSILCVWTSIFQSGSSREHNGNLHSTCRVHPFIVADYVLILQRDLSWAFGSFAWEWPLMTTSILGVATREGQPIWMEVDSVEGSSQLRLLPGGGRALSHRP